MPLSCAFPMVDEKNPFYCPAVSASAYVKTLRQKLSHKYGSRSNQPIDKLSFARLLDRSLLQSDDDDSSDVSQEWLPNPRLTPILSSGTRKGLPDVPAWEKDLIHLHLPSLPESHGESRYLHVLKPGSKRKRTSFSDFRRPAKHARSFQSVHDSSFDIEIKHEKLDYFSSLLCSPTRSVQSTPQLPPGLVSAINFDLLIDCLDETMPGIRLKERLQGLRPASHQSIASFLAENGHLNTRVLDILRSLDIQRLSLTTSLFDENGLNIYCDDFFPVFSKPNSFLYLSELSFSGTRVEDSCLMHIHHLPKLASLNLNNTGISNEAIFLLVPLKRSLIQLSVAINPYIDDDAVPALLLLFNLTFLTILDTSIEMPGLRRLASTILAEERAIDIGIPSVCEQYIDNLQSKYLIDPLPPLITNPEMCIQLSYPALKRNLAAHAEKNSFIVASGTKMEMVERLAGILKTRTLDLAVRDMLEGYDH